ncbi:hypothetical protein ACFP51_34980 [Streptomyces pratens]|uniref:Uncharacterized protein n=1 Tax=Streptomyces pratens TaxID=887456 RepID=A0ABW1LTI9_9ACTN
MYLLAETEYAHWQVHEPMGFAEVFKEMRDEDAGPEERREADLWRRGLRLDTESDATAYARPSTSWPLSPRPRPKR